MDDEIIISNDSKFEVDVLQVGTDIYFFYDDVHEANFSAYVAGYIAKQH